MKINYPVKYAAMPIIEQVGWTHGLNELERNYDVVCYIISKCYLLNDSTKYKEDGQVVKDYEVVFPYQRGDYGIWERTIPSFNLYDHDYCTNSNKVDFVFNSYEEALKYATIKNDELRKKAYVYLPYSEDISEKIQEKKDEFDDKLSKYKMLEQQIFFHTNDLEINKRTELDKVVTIQNNRAKIGFDNLYETIRVLNYQKFVVYTLTKEQYNTLTNLIQKECIHDIESIIGHTEGLLVYDPKDSLIRIANPNVEGVYYIDEDKRLHYSDELKKVTPDEFENIDEDTDVLYTNETFEDLISSYKIHQDIDLKKVQGPVLKKTKNRC